jgi:glutamine synthetase
MAVAQELQAPYGRELRPDDDRLGLDVRTAAFRLVGSGESMNFENRIPGADANFYLVMAGMIAAGLHGVEKRSSRPIRRCSHPSGRRATGCR